MKESRNRNWENPTRDQALVFFSQLVEELLFNYTIDSFKLPAHNVNTLIQEARKTIEHIKNDILKPGSYDSVKSELVDIISKDIVFKKLLKSNTDIAIKIINGNNLQETDRVLQYLKIQLQEDYKQSLCDIIELKISNNDFDDLNRLTKYLLIEIINSGYSIEYINMIRSRVFNHSLVNGIESYKVFIETFDKSEKTYHVFFKASNIFLQYIEFFSDDIVSVHDSLVFENTNSHINQFNKITGCVIEFAIKALDPFKAFHKAKYFLEIVISNLMFIQHQGDFSISKSGIIKEDDNFLYYTGTNNPILRRPDNLFTDKVKDKLRVILRCMNSEVLDRNSKNRISLAYFRHLNCLRSVSYETQLVDMWSGIEILVPIFNKDSTDKITQICDSIIPLITSEYFYKITFYLYKAIDNSLKKWPIIKILRTIDDNYYYALLKCMMLQEHQTSYAQIFNILDSYPLLQKRLDYYKVKLSSPKEILDIYKNHQTRVKWQIQRIYRGRNLIIHSGKTPYQLDTLIENLHYYFDTILQKINHEASLSVKYITLEHIFLTYKFHDTDYMKYLEKNKNVVINEEFIKKIVRKEF